jgi:alkylhydroperoxidase family enzyme
VLKGALSSGGQVSNFLGVLAGAPAVLRAYARLRSELRQGTLPLKSQQRIALAIAEAERSEYSLANLLRTARDAGLGLDEIARARQFESSDEREAALLRFVQAVHGTNDVPKHHYQEEALEAGWTDEQLLEAIAHVTVGVLTALITRAGNIPLDGSAEEGRRLQAA